MAKRENKEKAAVKTKIGLSAPLYSAKGEEVASLPLSKAVFGQKDNPGLIAQSVRVFLSNQHRSTAKTKDRSEVTGSTKKIWRQKGTGRARHGDRYAPIFVGGGRAHGPTGEQNYHLKMSKEMKKFSLAAALSTKSKEGKIAVFSQAESLKKTREAASFIKKVMENYKQKTKIVFVTEKKDVGLKKAFGNLENVTSVISVNNLNVYTVIGANLVAFQDKALAKLDSIFQK